MIRWLLDRVKALGYALKGVRWFFLNEKHALVHLIISVVILVGMYFTCQPLHRWVIMAILIAMLFAFEMMNSAFERVIDLIEPEKNETAGTGKDLAAGAVLVAGLTLLGVAAYFIIPRLFGYGCGSEVCAGGVCY